jgi:hypothetical protein
MYCTVERSLTAVRQTGMYSTVIERKEASKKRKKKKNKKRLIPGIEVKRVAH